MIGSSNAAIKTGGGASSIFNTVIDQDTTLAMNMPSFEQSWWEANYINWDSPDIPTDFTVTENVSSLNGAFGGSKLKTVNLSGGGENLSIMNGMFGENQQLESVDFSNLNAPNLTSLNGLLNNCPMLTEVVGLENLQAEDMGQILTGCSSLLTAPPINTSKATTVTNLFSGTGISTIPFLDLSQATDMSSIFNGCMNLVNADLRGYSTESITDMSGVFGYCSNLKNVNISGISSASATNTVSFFGNCSSIRAVVIDTPSVFAITSPATFQRSSITNGGTGFVYVPDNLVDEYKSATNWTTVADQIKPLSELPQEVKDVFHM